jgi:monovalent cation/proton antiporter MnhG/PhaG subunit
MENIYDIKNLIILLPFLYGVILSSIAIIGLFKMKNIYMLCQTTAIIDSVSTILCLLSAGLFFFDFTCTIKLIIIQLLMVMSSTISSYMLSGNSYTNNDIKLKSKT